MSDIFPQDRAASEKNPVIARLQELARQYPNRTILVNQHINQLRRALERPDRPTSEKIIAVNEAMAFIARVEAEPPIKLGPLRAKPWPL